MQQVPQNTPPTSSAKPEETANRKIILTVVQFIVVISSTFGAGYYIINNLSGREDKLREEISKVADNLTALDTSIKQVESSEQVNAQKVNTNFIKLQGRLEVIEKTTKVFVPPALTISTTQAEMDQTKSQP